MGLDNGLCYVTKEKIDFGNKLDSLYFPFGKSFNPEKDIYEIKRNGETCYEIEFAYWRKCWNVRHIIFRAMDKNDYTDEYVFSLTGDELREVVEELERYIEEPDRWEEDYEDGETIWDKEFIETCIAKQIDTINFFINYMEEYGGIIEFYDSY